MEPGAPQFFCRSTGPLGPDRPLYYKDIGSRKGLTPDGSNIEYEGSSDTVKNVYTSKVITDIRKLVTEGYIKIDRQTQNVEIVNEKATL